MCIIDAGVQILIYTSRIRQGWMFAPYVDGKEWWLGAEMIRILLLSSLTGLFARTCWMDCR